VFASIRSYVVPIIIRPPSQQAHQVPLERHLVCSTAGIADWAVLLGHFLLHDHHQQTSLSLDSSFADRESLGSQLLLGHAKSGLVGLCDILGLLEAVELDVTVGGEVG
jgi:hypothetical protein